MDDCCTIPTYPVITTTLKKNQPPACDTFGPFPDETILSNVDRLLYFLGVAPVQSLCGIPPECIDGCSDCSIQITHEPCPNWHKCYCQCKSILKETKCPSKKCCCCSKCCSCVSQKAICSSKCCKPCISKRYTPLPCISKCCTLSPCTSKCCPSTPCTPKCCTSSPCTVECCPPPPCTPKCCPPPPCIPKCDTPPPCKPKCYTPPPSIPRYVHRCVKPCPRKSSSKSVKFCDSRPRKRSILKRSFSLCSLACRKLKEKLCCQPASREDAAKWVWTRMQCDNDGCQFYEVYQNSCICSHPSQLQDTSQRKLIFVVLPCGSIVPFESVYCH